MQYSPEFSGPIEGYVVNGMKANYFRVERTLSREEYMSEAYLVFLRVKSKYGDKVEGAPHFMALFKRAWANELNDLANKDTQHRKLVAMPTTRGDDGEEGHEVELVGELDNEGALAIMIRQAPREVAMVLRLFLSAPQEVLELALQSWRGKDRRYANGGSERICRLLGLDPNLDVMQRVEDYFSVR